MFNKQTTQFLYGESTVTLETGEIARQATGSVLATMGETVVLATVVAKEKAQEGQDFFPLVVDYIEKFYAAGKIPGAYGKREGKPADHETLIARLIDRPLRPLFPTGFLNEVQVVIHVLSVDNIHPTDVLSMIAASAALSLSGIPFDGPMAGARIAYINQNYVLNPTFEQRKQSDLDLMLAGTKNAVLMVESEAKHLSEEVMLGAIAFGHQQLQTAIDAITALTLQAGKPQWNWQAPAIDTQLVASITEKAQTALTSAYQITQKTERSQAIKAVYADVLASLDEKLHSKAQNILFDLESKLVRHQILAGQPRIDGRDTRTVRPISIRNGVLPRTHGSSLFTRGETQALALVTLGTKDDEQVVYGIEGEDRSRFLLHYNMPPFATGEVGRVGTPKRREIGHGHLAKRALQAVLPSFSEFPYTIRVVSEILESNGSSSMASVCGGCLALLDAGVPVKAHVAGVAMGLILEDHKFAILTDILGDEDHLGDMDFKVAGSSQGITALQMDIKIQGITIEIMQVALAQAKEGRMHILGLMQESLQGYRTELSNYAPKLVKLTIPTDKIRDLIGKGGSNIQQLSRDHNCKIDVNEAGEVTISSSDAKGLEDAKRKIAALMTDILVDKVYNGTVQQILDFGVVIELIAGTGKTGLLHISEISSERVNNIRDYLTEGLAINVKVVQKDEAKNRVRLSMKDIEQPQALKDYMIEKAKNPSEEKPREQREYREPREYKDREPREQREYKDREPREQREYKDREPREQRENKAGNDLFKELSDH